ncbi:MAG: tRNA preQ1(34) S-adenosylmethionine ribosyltransferase-isomerase QueA [Candidatus Peregrinibacteria bacterium]
MKTFEFDYNLPRGFIAQYPAEPRDSSKLMIFDTKKNSVSHVVFRDLADILGSDDVLVVNRSKVIPARILFDADVDAGVKKCEVFILKNLGGYRYKAMVKPGKFFTTGRRFRVNDELFGMVEEIFDDGTRNISFNRSPEKFGKTPLPPYIKNTDVKSSSYQTVYAKEKGSVAAPTAGLHFTPGLIGELKNKGVKFEEVILHVGRGTFLPVKSEDISDHVMHEECYEIPERTAFDLNEAIKNGKRITAVGTTSVRVLESSFDSRKGFVPKTGETDIFIYPGGHDWKCVDALITNFHLPKSTLIMLVASFLEHKGVKGPVKKILELYELAKENNYRFYSFGDAMFIF